MPALPFPQLGSISRVALPRLGEMAPMLSAPRGRVQQEDLSPESLAKMAGGMLVGGLTGIARVLDLPGATVRGKLVAPMIGMKTASVWDEADKIYGRDILDHLGVTNRNKPGLFNSLPDFAGDVAGFMVDVTLDPLNLLFGLGIGARGAKFGAEISAKIAPKLAAPGAQKILSEVAEQAYKKAAKAGSKAPGEAALLARQKKIVELVPDLKGSTAEFLRQVDRMGQPGARGVLPGTTPFAVAQEIEDKTRHLLTVNAPWPFSMAYKKPLKELGTGPWAADLYRKLVYGLPGDMIEKLARTPGLAGKASPLSIPIRFYRTVLGNVEGKFDAVQQITRDIAVTKQANFTALIQDVSPVISAHMEVLKHESTGVLSYLKAIGDDHGFKEFKDLTRNILETDNLSKDTLRTIFREMPNDVAVKAMLPGGIDPYVDKWYQLYETNNSLADGMAKMLQDLGLDMETLREVVGVRYLHRQPVEALARTGELVMQGGKLVRKSLLDRGLESTIARREPLRHWVGGSRIPNIIAQDHLIRGVRMGQDAQGPTMSFLDEATHREELIEWLQRALTGQEVEGAAIGALKGVEAIRKTPLSSKQLLALKDAPIEDLEGAVAFAKYIAPQLTDAKLIGDKNILKYYLQGVPEDEVLKAGGKVVSVLGERTEAHLPLLIKHIRNLRKTKGDNAALATVETGIIGREVIQDLHHWMIGAIETAANLFARNNLIRRTVVKAGDAPPEGFESLSHSLAPAYMTPGGEFKSVSTMTPRGKEKLVREIAEDLGEEVGDNWEDFARQLYIPGETARAMNAYTDLLKPKVVSDIGRWWDQMTGVWKWSFTVPWPAFHARNMVSALWQTWSDTGDVLKLPGVVKEYMKVGWMMARGDLKSHPHFHELAQHDWLGLNRSQLLDIGGPSRAGKETLVRRPWRGPIGKETAEETAARLRTPSPYLGADRSAIAEIVDPIAHPGKYGARAPLDVTDRMYAFSEGIARIANYAVMRNRNFTAGQAANLVRKTQFDYGQLSPFLRTVGRRAVPFVGWISKNIPYQLAKIAREPGGATAQTLRLMETLSRESGIMPNFLRGRSAIRIPSPDEDATFMHYVGLPIEDLENFQFNRKFGVPSVWPTIKRFSSILHPFATMAVRGAFREDPYTGRPIKYLKGPSGVPDLDILLTTAPGYRGWSLYRQITNPKGSTALNLVSAMTGPKISTYDSIKWQLIDAKQRMQEISEMDPAVRQMTIDFIPELEEGEEIPEESLRRVEEVRKVAKQLQRYMAERRK